MISLGLALLTYFVFGQVIGFGFVDYDDSDYVYGNPHVVRGVTWDGVRWAFGHTYASNWHPLTWISHMLDCEVYGIRPGGHHFTNIVLHAATAILLFLSFSKITTNLWRSGIVVSIFAIHPLHVESVAWIAERKDVLSGFLFILTLRAYGRYAREEASHRWYLAAVLLHACGLMCKPMLVTTPLILLLLDYWPLRRLRDPLESDRNVLIPYRRLVLEKAPFFALSAASCAITLLAQRTAMKSVETVSLPLRLSNACVSYVLYLAKTVWPTKLAVFYPFPEWGTSCWAVLASLIIMSVC